MEEITSDYIPPEYDHAELMDMFGIGKIQAIKAFRYIAKDWGLKESKDAVEAIAGSCNPDMNFQQMKRHIEHLEHELLAAKAQVSVLERTLDRALIQRVKQRRTR